MLKMLVAKVKNWKPKEKLNVINENVEVLILDLMLVYRLSE